METSGAELACRGGERGAGAVRGGTGEERRRKERRQGGAAAFQVPVEYYKLPNGLRVVLSQDHTAPTVCVAVYYRIGFRIEPKDRTGFAHLFEHMMFQGSQNLGRWNSSSLCNRTAGR